MFWNHVRQSYTFTSRPDWTDRRIAVFETKDWKEFTAPELALQADALDLPPADLSEWDAVVEAKENPTATVNVAMVGKYMDLKDSYISLVEALQQTVRAAHAEDAGGRDDVRRAMTHAWLITGPPGSGRSVVAAAIVSGNAPGKPDRDVADVRAATSAREIASSLSDNRGRLKAELLTCGKTASLLAFNVDPPGI